MNPISPIFAAALERAALRTGCRPSDLEAIGESNSAAKHKLAAYVRSGYIHRSAKFGSDRHFLTKAGKVRLEQIRSGERGTVTRLTPTQQQPDFGLLCACLRGPLPAVAIGPAPDWMEVCR